MAATKVETLTTPRDSLPNVYTGVTARELDFVTRFADNWEALREIYGIMRPIRKQAGTSLVSYTASIALESGTVPAGAVIPCHLLAPLPRRRAGSCLNINDREPAFPGRMGVPVGHPDCLAPCRHRLG